MMEGGNRVIFQLEAHYLNTFNVTFCSPVRHAPNIMVLSFTNLHVSKQKQPADCYYVLQNKPQKFSFLFILASHDRISSTSSEPEKCGFMFIEPK